MRKVGNVVSNKIYNPENKRPPVPVDADEADSAMERFIRQKYMNNVAATPSSGKPTSPQVEEGPPPPLPPKNSSKFSLRSATSLFPLSSRSKKEASMPSPTIDRRPSSHGSTGKVSRMFGASVSYDDGDDTDRKLGKLRDMGFHDTQRNAIVLKGVNGNLERAIESLVRLGEGGRKSPAPPPISKDANLRPSRSMTPLNGAGGAGAGLSLTPKEQPRSPSSTSNNPFDRVSSPVHPQPQTAQSTGSMQNNNPYNQSLNPFGAPAQQQDQLTQVFGQLDVSGNNQQQQPLFPNRTGGLTPQAQNAPQYPPQMAPSAPSSPQVYQDMTFQSMTYPQSTPLQQQPTGYNPFFQNSASPAPQQQHQQYQQQYQPQFQQQYQQQFQQPNLYINTQQHPHQQQQSPVASNPFGSSQTRIASPTSLGQIPEQSQPPVQSTAPGPAAGNNNPFFTSPVQTPTNMPQQAYGQPGYFQPPRHDKASIMALYGMYPQRSLTTDGTQPLPTQSIPEDSVAPSQPQPAPSAQSPSEPPGQPTRSMTQPLPQSNTTNNPFMNGGAATAAPTDPFQTQRHISRESMNLGMDMAWTNGRHSPDAFASLARHG